MKKTIAILLLLCLVASTFAGCSSPKADDGTGTTDHTTVEAGTTAPDPDEQTPTDGDNAPAEPTDHSHAFGVDQLCEICGWAYSENLYYFRFVGTGDGYYNIVSYSGNAEHVIIPQKYNGKPVRALDGNVFENRSNILSVTIPNTIYSIGYHAFAGCTALTTLTIPGSVTDIHTAAFEGCTGLKSVVFEEGVTTVEGLIGCTNLTDVTIPESATAIGSNAFQNCSSLTSIDIPDGVREIGGKAFDGCTGLIEVENGISYVDGWAVLCNASVTDAVLREGTVGIAIGTFMDMASLKSITVPTTVKSISMHCAYNCPGLSHVYYNGTEAQWNEIRISTYNDLFLAAEVVFQSISTPIG